MIRENAERMAEHDVTPIIEPVKANLAGLKRALDQLTEKNVNFVLIANPQYGDLVYDSTSITEEIIDEKLYGYTSYSVGIIVHADSDITHIEDLLKKYSDKNIALIHYGYTRGKELGNLVKSTGIEISENIFIDEESSRLYRRHFKQGKRVLIRDGFIKRTNREHPEIEYFSDLHITHGEAGMDDFGDFLIAGDEFSEDGGPAYAVALHLTLIYEEEYEDMFVKHYISDRTNTPDDPAGKFLEALAKVVEDVNK